MPRSLDRGCRRSRADPDAVNAAHVRRRAVPIGASRARPRRPAQRTITNDNGNRFDVADRAEEVARRELRRLRRSRGRVGRREHQVGLARDVVQLLHRVTGRSTRRRPPRSLRGPRRSRCSGGTRSSRGRPARRHPVYPRRSTSLVRISRLGTRALPPRRPNDTKPSTRRPDLAGAADVGAAPATAEHRCRRSRPTADHVGDEHDFLHRHVDALREAARQGRHRGERGFGPGVRVAGGLGAAHRRPVGVAGAHMFPDAAITPRSRSRSTSARAQRRRTA